MTARNFFLLASLMLALNTASAAHTEVKLLLPAAAKTGETMVVGVQLKMESGWHTYWKNPGDAGQATEIKWQLPPGVTAGNIQWPLPQKLPPAEVTTYGYENEVVLLVPLKLDKGVPPGLLNLAAKVSWLECKDSCIPASGEIKGTVTAGSEAKPSADSVRIKSWQTKVPATAGIFFGSGHWISPAVTPGGSCHLISVACPASPGFFQ